MSLIACIRSAFSSLITSGLLCLPSLPIHRRSLCGSSCWSCVTVSVPRVWGVVPFPMLSFSDIVYIPALSCTSIIVKIFIFTCPSSLFHRAFVGGPVIFSFSDLSILVCRNPYVVLSCCVASYQIVSALRFVHLQLLWLFGL